MPNCARSECLSFEVDQIPWASNQLSLDLNYYFSNYGPNTSNNNNSTFSETPRHTQISYRAWARRSNPEVFKGTKRMGESADTRKSGDWKEIHGELPSNECILV